MTDALFDVPATEPEIVLPDLTGSEKQVRWATDIRTRLLREMRQAPKEERLLLTRAAEQGLEVPGDGWARLDDAECLLLTWQQETRADRWIDVRSRSARWLLGFEELG